MAVLSPAAAAAAAAAAADGPRPRAHAPTLAIAAAAAAADEAADVAVAVAGAVPFGQLAADPHALALKVDKAQPSFLKRNQHLMEFFIAGGLAGATSRTVVSPLERLKIIMQVQSSQTVQTYTGVWPSLKKMWREEGWRGYMKGNGINCLRIMPYSAVQFTSYEMLKKFAKPPGSEELSTARKLACGSLAGILSVCSTYPLDLVRSRLSISAAQLGSAGSGLGIAGMTAKVWREEGKLKGLYRGCGATSAGVAPYVALNFVLYEKFRTLLLPAPSAGAATASELGRDASIKLLCGSIAGAISQTVTYPFDLVRRKMQVVGLKPAPGAVKVPGAYDYTSGTGALVQIVQKEGVRGLYRGIWPNLLKVSPSQAVSFLTYETVLSLLKG